MATRQAMEAFLQHCEDTIRTAQEEYKEAAKQEHYSDQEFLHAQRVIEDTVFELEKMANSANEQQREQLQRMKIQLEHLQNNMILLDH